jgi:hypothetical protein
MLTGKEYLDGVASALQEEIDVELQRLAYFLKANARIHNTRFPFLFLVKHCKLEVIDAIAAHLIEAGWQVEKNKDFLRISPVKPQSQTSLIPRK